MEQHSLHIEKREKVGSGKARRLRSSGYIPAVVYGHGVQSVAAQVKETDLREFLNKYGRNSLFTTEFAQENDVSILVKDMQVDPVNKKIIHLDLQRVFMTEKVHAVVPIRLIGREKIEKAGSVVVHQINSVTVECLPQDVPQYIEAEISGMTPGHNLTAGDLLMPQGVILVNKPSDVIMAVTGGRLELKVHKEDEPVVAVGTEGHLHAREI